MRTAERPRLEVNAQPLRELAQAIELVGERPLLRTLDILSLILLRQQLTAQRQELEALRVRLAIAEQAVATLAPSANDARRWG